MNRFIAVLCGSLGAVALVHAGPYDYSYGSMARHEEASRENAFNKYMSSGAHNYSAGSSINSKEFADSIRKIFDHPEPARYSAPARPPRIGDAGWAEYWKDYVAPTYRDSAPVVDTRSPQQKRIDAAKGGDTIVMWNIGHDYLAGRNGFPESQESGVYWLQTAFEHGKLEAATELFYYFDPDWHTSAENAKKDPIQSLYWLQKAAKAGDPDAMKILGGRMLQGAGVPQDTAEGLRLLKAALAAGEDGALIELVAAYEYGWGVSKDLKEAVKWQREAVERGMGLDYRVNLVRLLALTDDPQTHTNVAEMEAMFASVPKEVKMQLIHAKLADTGALGPRDPAKCVALCRQIIAAKGGGSDYDFGEAHYLLADHLYEGDGVPQDEIAAYQSYCEARKLPYWASSRNNYYFASLLTGRLKGKNEAGEWTVIDEPKTALPLFRAAADDGKLPQRMRAQAEFQIAHLLAVHPDLVQESEQLTVRDRLRVATQYDSEITLVIAEAMREGWFGEAEKRGARGMAAVASSYGDSRAGFVEAMWKCEDTDGDDSDWQAGMETALTNKVWDAYVWMSDHLISGKYLPKNPGRAEELLRTAATEGNHSQAQNNLGAMLWKGVFGENKVTEGLAWMDKSLNNGQWVAGRNLAKIYHLGLNVEKDEAKAKAYLERAGKTGGRAAAIVVAEAYEKGDIIAADAEAAATWKKKAMGQ